MGDNLNLDQWATNQNQPEVPVNTSLLQLSSAFGDDEVITFTTNAYTVLVPEFQQYAGFLATTGSGLTGTGTLTFAAQKRAIFYVENTSAQTVNVVVGSTSFSVLTGFVGTFRQDGTTNGLTRLFSGAISTSSGGGAEIDIAPDFLGASLSNKQFNYPLNRAASLPTNLAGTQIFVGTAATADTTFTVKKNGSSIGTIVFHSSGSPTITVTATSFAIGDTLSIAAPGSADATLADVTVNFKLTLS